MCVVGFFILERRFARAEGRYEGREMNSTWVHNMKLTNYQEKDLKKNQDYLKDEKLNVIRNLVTIIYYANCIFKKYS